MVILISMKIAVSIPDELFQRAEAAAKREGLSRSGLYSRALASYLAAEGDPDDDPVTSKLNEMADVINGAGSLPSHLIASRLIDSGAWEW